MQRYGSGRNGFNLVDEKRWNLEKGIVTRRCVFCGHCEIGDFGAGSSKRDFSVFWDDCLGVLQHERGRLFERWDAQMVWLRSAYRFV